MPQTALNGWWTAPPGLTSWTLTRWRYQHTSDKVAHCSIYRPRKDAMFSWPSWLTCSGRFIHKNGHPSAAGRAQDRESTPVEDGRSTNCATHTKFCARIQQLRSLTVEGYPTSKAKLPIECSLEVFCLTYMYMQSNIVFFAVSRYLTLKLFYKCLTVLPTINMALLPSSARHCLPLWRTPRCARPAVSPPVTNTSRN